MYKQVPVSLQIGTVHVLFSVKLAGTRFETEVLLGVSEGLQQVLKTLTYATVKSIIKSIINLPGCLNPKPATCL